MHRNPRMAGIVCPTLLVALVLGSLLPAKAAGQEAAPPPKVSPLVVQLNTTKLLQVSSKKKLKTVTNQDPNIARVAPVEGDPTKIQVTGLRAGVTRITLVDEKNFAEAYEVTVQTNLEHLRSVLRELVPTSNIQLVPVNEVTVGLNGVVERTEDIDVVLRAVQAMGYQIINHLRTDAVSQVQLCVVVARVDRVKLRQMGFNFITNGGNSLLGSTVGNVIPPLAPVGLPSAQLQPSLAGQLLNATPSQANVFTGALFPSWGFLGFLQALEQENLVKLMAEPRLVTISGRPASFLSGGEQAVPVPAGLGQVGVQFEEFGTRLNFLPIVLGNGKIHLEVEPEVSELSAAGETTLTPGGSPVLGRLTQRVHTTVELEDGQTFAIGGLIQHRIPAAQITKLPILGSLPFIGTIFSTKSYTEGEEELVVLVTPHLVDPMDCRQAPRVLPGEETRSADDFELFLEGILEAPRGPRQVFPGGHYMPAYKNGPTAGQFPCADAGKSCTRRHGLKGGGTGGCAALPMPAGDEGMPLGPHDGDISQSAAPPMAKEEQAPPPAQQQTHGKANQAAGTAPGESKSPTELPQPNSVLGGEGGK